MRDKKPKDSIPMVKAFCTRWKDTNVYAKAEALLADLSKPGK